MIRELTARIEVNSDTSNHGVRELKQNIDRTSYQLEVKSRHHTCRRRRPPSTSRRQSGQAKPRVIDKNLLFHGEPEDSRSGGPRTKKRSTNDKIDNRDVRGGGPSRPGRYLPSACRNSFLAASTSRGVCWQSRIARSFSP